MSEYPAITLVLGIIGTLTGSFALFISFLKYYYDKPRLSVEVKRFEHTQSNNNPQIQNFYIVIDVKNKGNHPTTLNELELSFSVAGIVYFAKEPIKEDYYALFPRDMIKVDIEAGKTIEKSLFFRNEHFFEIKQVMEEIPCHLTLYHTHKAVKFDAKSKRVLK
jgi:hypothetical protein